MNAIVDRFEGAYTVIRLPNNEVINILSCLVANVDINDTVKIEMEPIFMEYDDK